MFDRHAVAVVVGCLRALVLREIVHRHAGVVLAAGRLGRAAGRWARPERYYAAIVIILGQRSGHHDCSKKL